MNIPESTAEVAVPQRLLDRIIGQERGVDAVRLAARQHRFLLLIGEPGTGKSLLGQAVAELLGSVQPVDVLAWENRQESTRPQIQAVTAGEGERTQSSAVAAHRRSLLFEQFLLWVLITGTIVLSGFYALRAGGSVAALGVGAAVLFGLVLLHRQLVRCQLARVPKVLVAHGSAGTAPFIDATGCQAGALLGDVRHDPYQSGGSETPPHQLLEPGAIHRAHGGVLFIDELSTLSLESQQSLLTAIQEQKMPITGRSPGSSGTMVCSEPVPCKFLLVVAGNVEDVNHLHPALRSRLRGYGYEVLTNTLFQDCPENTQKMIQFIAQEVRQDGRIPHVRQDGITAILDEARRRSGTTGAYTARLRELGGLIRTAGDLAVQEGAELITSSHVAVACEFARPLEEQTGSAPVSVYPEECMS